MLADAILNHVEKLKPNLLELAQSLVRIPSENPPGNEEDVTQFL